MSVKDHLPGQDWLARHIETDPDVDGEARSMSAGDLSAVVRDIQAHIDAVQRERRTTKNGQPILDAINALPAIVRRLEAIDFQTDADFEALEDRLEALADRLEQRAGWVMVPRKALPAMLERAAFNLCAEYGVEFVKPLGKFVEDAYEELVSAAMLSSLPPAVEESK